MVYVLFLLKWFKWYMYLVNELRLLHLNLGIPRVQATSCLSESTFVDPL